MADFLEITRPDDAHVHLRDGAALGCTAAFSAAQFARALVMPNLLPPVTGVAEALAYRSRILEALGPEPEFEPLMALYLTDETRPAEVRRVAETPGVLAFKLYPKGATTHSQAGVTRLAALAPTLEAMQEHGVPLCIHGEATDPGLDVFDREKIFVAETLAPLLEDFPGLRVVLEHITTREAAQFVGAARAGVAATITPQHLLLNRNDLFAGGLRPHHYCLPLLKRAVHQRELQRVAISGNPRFFLGSDSAPHSAAAKESACGCAGCFCAPVAIELYAEVFDALDALDKLEGFASHFAAEFYGLPRNTSRVRLERKTWRVPETIELSPTEESVPLWAGRELSWKLA